METLKTIEFYTSPDGSVYYKVPGQESRRLTKFNVDIIDPLLEQIKQRFPECYAALATKYRNKRFSMADRFVRCNFGEHDLLTQDIDNEVMHFEEVRCPLRGNLCLICSNSGSMSCTSRRCAALFVVYASTRVLYASRNRWSASVDASERLPTCTLRG